MRKDIETRADIETLVDKFYQKIQEDGLLKPFFSHVNWQSHLPVMYSFWSSVVLGEQSYKGMPFHRHAHLPLDHVHFNRWLMLFHTTVDELFEGERAEDVKARTLSIAGIFQHRMGISVPV